MKIAPRDRNHIQILKNAHRILIPNRKFAPDVVNECNMIKIAIKDLVRSTIPEGEKYSILLQLAVEARLDIDPNFSLWEIGSAVQDYYMNVCLNINPEVSENLTLLWGLGVKRQVDTYQNLCKSIYQKFYNSYSNTHEIPKHIVTMMYDPEIGFFADVYHRYPFTKLEEDMIYSADLIVMKLGNLDKFQHFYKVHKRYNDLEYVTPDLEITPKEVDFFLDYYKHDDTNEVVIMNREQLNKLRDKLNLTNKEIDFILMVRENFLNKKYPFTMLWEDLCRQL